MFGADKIMMEAACLVGCDIQSLFGAGGKTFPRGEKRPPFFAGPGKFLFKQIGLADLSGGNFESECFINSRPKLPLYFLAEMTFQFVEYFGGFNSCSQHLIPPF